MIRIGFRIDSQPGPTRSGYASSLEGASLEYHSSHPDADTALLIRACAGMRNIAWLTEAPPPEGDTAVFRWLGGIAGCQGGPHGFLLLAEGIPLLELETTAKGMLPRARYEGAQGSVLEYEHLLTDMCGDHFGLFRLTLPRCFCPAGGVRLELQAEDAGSQDWMMVFEYPFPRLPLLRPAPILVKRGNEIRQRLDFVLDSPGGSLELELPEGGTRHQTLTPGANTVSIDIPRLTQTTILTAEIYLNGRLEESREHQLEPAAPREVHILPFSHNDIGYTELQDRVAHIQRGNIGQALDLIQASRGHPFEAVSKWNLEVIWALETWWEEASADNRERFVQAVREGCLGLNALYANPLTGLSSLAAIHHHLDLARKISHLTGLGIDTAAVTDIPGFVWSLQAALALGGVGYLAIAPNAGDRTGFIYEGLGVRPFWWASPCGRRRVLTWVMGAGYSLFHKEKLTGTGLRKLMRYLTSLDRSGYPYRIVPLPYTIGGDNGGPDEALADFVKNWNEEHFSPRLIIATHAQFFREFEREHGAELPVLKGDMTPYWEDGAMSTARETVLARQASDRLNSVETLASLFLPEDLDETAFYRAWQQVVLWEEHTWGAWNSVSDPDLPFVKRQWEVKQGFAQAADRLSLELQQALCGEPEGEITFMNPLSWGGLRWLRLPDTVTKGRSLLDQSGMPLPQQRLGDGLLLGLDFAAGWESRQARLEQTDTLAPAMPESDITSAAVPESLETKYFRLEFDPAAACINRLYDRERGMDLLRTGLGLGELFYVAEGDTAHPFRPEGAELLVWERGSLCNRLRFQAELKGCSQVEIEYVIYHQDKRIDLTLTIDKLPVRSRESLHAAFPFAFDGALLRYDSAGAPLLPKKDQLPGTCRNFYSPTSYADVSNGACGVTVALTDAPLIEIGGLTGEQPWIQELEPDTVFYSYLMNNIWHTNYKADQEGRAAFRYNLLFHGPFRPEESLFFALQQRQPPLLCASGRLPSVPAFPLPAPPPPLLVLSLSYHPNQQAWHLLLLNAGAEPVAWTLPDPGVLHIIAGDAPAAPGKPVSGALTLLPFEQIRLVLKRPLTES
jgi:hypothetical protein